MSPSRYGARNAQNWMIVRPRAGRPDSGGIPAVRRLHPCRLSIRNFRPAEDARCVEVAGISRKPPRADGRQPRPVLVAATASHPWFRPCHEGGGLGRVRAPVPRPGFFWLPDHESHTRDRGPGDPDPDLGRGCDGGYAGGRGRDRGCGCAVGGTQGAANTSRRDPFATPKTARRPGCGRDRNSGRSRDRGCGVGRRVRGRGRGRGRDCRRCPDLGRRSAWGAV